MVPGDVKGSRLCKNNKKRTVNKTADKDIYFLYWQLKYIYIYIDYKRTKVQNAMLLEGTVSLTRKYLWEVGGEGGGGLKKESKPTLSM